MLSRRHLGFTFFLLVVGVFVNLSQTFALLFCKGFLAKGAFFVCVVYHTLILFKRLHGHYPLDEVVVRWLYVAFIVISEHLPHLFVESVEFDLVYLQFLYVELNCLQSLLILSGK